MEELVVKQKKYGRRMRMVEQKLHILEEYASGAVAVSEPNKRWASDITAIKAWNGEKGQFAIGMLTLVKFYKKWLSEI